ncbi:MAG TPA: pilus assembly protein TadG-related protein [Chthonomonadaceae bacterium]|nr:pilus assembly protein TadG-related protein [Chthonomonadaceae bacterium]
MKTQGSVRRHYVTKSHTGAVLPIILFALTALLGMAAVAIDLAAMYGARQRAQNVADAAALAGAKSLPDTSTATTVANQVIATNNSNGTTFTMTSITYTSAGSPSVTLDDGSTLNVGANNAITVTGYVNAPLSFAPIIGYSPTSNDGLAKTRSVSATATVYISNACTLPAGSPLAPFGVVADDPTSSDSSVAYMASLLSTATSPQTPALNTYQPVSKQVTLKVSEWKSGSMDSGGNFGALAIGGNGANAYNQAIGGRTSRAFSVGDWIDTKPGNMVGPTRQGVSYRLDSSNTSFTHKYSSYTDWFFGDPSLPIDTTKSAVTDGATTYYYRQDPNRQDPNDAHVMILPLISQPSKNGRAQAQILAFAAFFIENTSSSDNSVVYGRFIGLASPSANGGTCTGGGAEAFKLIR